MQSNTYKDMLGARQKGESSEARASNLELYRIIVMLLIVAHHYVVNSGLMELVNEDSMSGSSIFLLLFGAWGKTGINCFVLITGYFMCKSQISVKKFVRLLLEVCFYRIVFYMIFMLTGYTQFSLKSFVKVLLPFTAIEQNFVGCYLMFYLCIPFLNILVRNMNEVQHFRLILLVCFIYVILGTVPMIDVSMNYVTWFVVLYFVASYIRCYPRSIFENTYFWGWMTAAAVLISALSVVACAWVGKKLGNGLAYYFVADSNKILAVVTGVCSFMFFKNVKIKHSRLINTISASTLGVLLIHANSDTMRQWLWKDILNNSGMYESSWLALHAVASVVCVFAVCTAIDYLRIRFVEIPFLRLWDKHCGPLLAWYRDKELKLLQRLNNKE